MGVYINPSDRSKEEWLKENGEPFDITLYAFENRPLNTLPVILVHNGAFTAAGITFDRKEYISFTAPIDNRFKLGFYVDIDKLLTIAPDLKSYMKRAE